MCSQQPSSHEKVKEVLPHNSSLDAGIDRLPSTFRQREQGCKPPRAAGVWVAQSRHPTSNPLPTAHGHVCAPDPPPHPHDVGCLVTEAQAEAGRVA